MVRRADQPTGRAIDPKRHEQNRVRKTARLERGSSEVMVSIRARSMLGAGWLTPLDYWSQPLAIRSHVRLAKLSDLSKLLTTLRWQQMNFILISDVR